MPLELIRPRRWLPPRAPARAYLSASPTPLGELRRFELPGAGPEDVVVDADGMLLTGLSDGRVLRVDPASGACTELANTGGRPLGLEPCPDGAVLVCDSVRGLLHVARDGAVEALVAEVDGAPLTFASNAARDDDGTIYFSASTRHFDLDHYLGDLLEHSNTGRLFRRTPDGAVETLLDGLKFANGVVLAPDNSCVVVAETAGYRISRYWLTGSRAGTRDLLVDNLPGFPDNMALGSDGLIWVSLPTTRNPVLDLLLPLPGALRQLAWMLPEAARPRPAATTWAIAVSWDGEIVHDRQAAQHACGYSMVTSAIERDGTVYLGSLHESALAAFEL